VEDDLVLRVGDLFGHLERSREFAGTRDVSLRLVETTVNGPMDVSGAVVGTLDGVQVTFTTGAIVNLECVRCLKRWDERLESSGSQHFSATPDEDGYGVVDGQIDVGAPATDELALSLPAAPLCRKECLGLCPICGTDLNSDPCDGHGDDSVSPFSVLKDLFDS
jgi:uncharacterized protein